tara:strand:+ start:1502 stop:2404 length:903 start_codon:yes stop_codon:yes gene_type:complete
MKPRQKRKRNHWVPKAYLKAFASNHPAKTKIWRFGKDSGDPELKPISKVAVSFYLYAKHNDAGEKDYELEHRFASLEQLFGNPFWRELTNGFADLTDEATRKGIALLAANLYLRNPLRLTDTANLHADLVSQFEGWDFEPGETLNVEINEKAIELDTSDWERYRNAGPDLIKAMWIDSIYEYTAWLAELLMGLRWAVVFSETPVFVTSDNPVVLLNPNDDQPFGFKTPGSVTIFPLSPTRVLQFDNSKEPDGHYYPVNDPADSNYLIWSNSISHMFCHRHPDQVLWEIMQSAEKFEAAGK